MSSLLRVCGDNINMFKFVNTYVKGFVHCEHLKLDNEISSAVRRQLAVCGGGAVNVYVDPEDMASTLLLTKIKEERADVCAFTVSPASPSLQTNGRTHITVSIRVDVPEAFSVLQLAGDDLIRGLPFYVLCRHLHIINQTDLFVPTLAAELLGGTTDFLNTFDFDGDPFSVAQTECLRQLEDANKTLLPWINKCADHFGIRIHYPFADNNVLKFALFLNKHPKIVDGRYQLYSTIRKLM